MRGGRKGRFDCTWQGTVSSNVCISDLEGFIWGWVGNYFGGASTFGYSLFEILWLIDTGSLFK